MHGELGTCSWWLEDLSQHFSTVKGKSTNVDRQLAVSAYKAHVLIKPSTNMTGVCLEEDAWQNTDGFFNTHSHHMNSFWGTLPEYCGAHLVHGWSYLKVMWLFHGVELQGWRLRRLIRERRSTLLHTIVGNVIPGVWLQSLLCRGQGREEQWARGEDKMRCVCITSCFHQWYR